MQAENVMCHIGAEETLETFNENLRGAKTGEQRKFRYREIQSRLRRCRIWQGKTYSYVADVTAIKEKKLPELNDDFAKDVSESTTLADLRTKIKEQLIAGREHKINDMTREKILAYLVAKNEFPVPETLVEHQMDARLERAVRSLAQQGVDPRAVNVDWVAMRARQKDRAVEDVKAELILDRISTAEKIEADEADVDKEINHLAEHGGESATVVRARLTKDGVLDRMKSKLRSEKTLEWLRQNARIQVSAKSESTEINGRGHQRFHTTFHEKLRRSDTLRDDSCTHGGRTDQPRRARL